MFLLALTGPSFAQVAFQGQCQAPKVVSPLTATKLTSPTWYEARRYYSWLEGNNYCVNWRFAGTGSTFTATTSMRNWFWGTRSFTSTLIQKNPSANSADFNYVANGVAGTYNYQILALTDDYMLAWSCLNYPLFNRHIQMFWVLTAAKHPSAAIVNSALAAAATAGLTVDAKKLHTVQQNC